METVYYLSMDGEVASGKSYENSQKWFGGKAIDGVCFVTKSVAQQAYFDLKNGETTINELVECQREKGNGNPLNVDDWRNPDGKVLNE